MGREESRWYKPRKKTSEEDAEIVKSGEEVSDKKDWQHYRERGVITMTEIMFLVLSVEQVDKVIGDTLFLLFITGTRCGLLPTSALQPLQLTLTHSPTCAHYSF